MVGVGGHAGSPPQGYSPKELCRVGAELLACKDTAVLDAQLLLCHVLECNRIDIVTNPNMIISELQKNCYMDYVKKRANGVPLEHITGSKEFMSLPFFVNQHVLIPRPDTETLVERVMENVKSGRILEIGTGSGCIAVSLAKYLPNVTIDAIDISVEALDVARRNAATNGVSVNFIQKDVMEDFDGMYDAVVSNPPYIESDTIAGLMPEVQKEPLIALDGGIDGLDFYRRIISGNFLKPGGYIAFEVGHNQAKAVMDMMGEFNKVSAWQDLSGISRVVDGVKS